MSTFALDPRKHIDRVADKEIFTTLLQLADDARVLAICDKGGMGKSSLLKWFDYHCRWGGPDVPSTLTVLSEFNDHTPFGLIAKIRAEFGDNANLDFSRFDELDYARARQMPEAFGPRGRSRGTATARTVNRGIVGGNIDRAFAGNVGTYNEAAPVWTPDLEHRARTACVNAFFDDLREIAAERPFVMILDAFEKCRDPLRSWVRDGLLRPHVLGDATRCHGLVVVIAGRELSEVAELPDELQERFVRSIESLKDWETEHLRDFLKAHGFDPSDSDVNWIQEKVGEGRMSLVAALQLVQQLRSEIVV